MVLGIICVLILFSIALINPKSRLGFALTLLFIWVLYSFATITGDWTGYSAVYEAFIGDDGIHMYFEPTFTLLMLICRGLHLSIGGFRIVCGTIFTILLALVINKYTKYTAAASLLFLIFPFPHFSSVMRSGLALLVLALFVDNLFVKKKFWYLKYAIGLALAISIHYSFAFFILLYFVAFVKMKLKNYIIIVFSLTLMMILFYNSGIIYEIVYHIFGEGKLSRYANPNAGGASFSNATGIMTSFGVVFFNIFASYLFSKLAEEYSFDSNSEEENYICKMANFMTYANVLSLLTLPFLLITTVFLRYSYYFVLFNILVGVNAAYLVASNSRSKFKLFKKYQIVSSPLYVYTFLIFVYSELAYINEPFSGFKMFENNSILNFLGF